MDEQAGTLQNAGIVVVDGMGFVWDLLKPALQIHWKSKYEGTIFDSASYSW